MTLHLPHLRMFLAAYLLPIVDYSGAMTWESDQQSPYIVVGVKGECEDFITQRWESCLSLSASL